MQKSDPFSIPISIMYPGSVPHPCLLPRKQRVQRDGAVFSFVDYSCKTAAKQAVFSTNCTNRTEENRRQDTRINVETGQNSRFFARSTGLIVPQLLLALCRPLQYSIYPSRNGPYYGMTSFSRLLNRLKAPALVKKLHSLAWEVTPRRA